MTVSHNRAQGAVVSTSPSPENRVAGDGAPSQGSHTTELHRAPQRQRTQEDQDKEDEKARKKAEEDLEKSWMDRLQLISVITTFFAATEAQLLSITTPSEGGSSSSGVNQAANAGLAGALVFHSFAAILSFVAAFVLIRFRLHEAKKEQQEHPSDTEKQEVWSRNPHIGMERVGYRQKEPPVHLLQRFHSLCISMTVVGFVLAAAGILCFVWATQARSVGVFSSACLGVCVVAGPVVLFMR